jgi:DNA-binding FadR family transcriptional regulator
MNGTLNLAMKKKTPTPPASPMTVQLDRTNFLRAPKLPELMAGDVRRRIMAGELNEGDALPPEADLMQRYNISRPSLREALRILESEALIVVRRGGLGGATVKRPTLEVTARHFGLILQDRGAQVEDVYRARAVLEPPAVGDLARVATATQVAALRERLAAASKTIGSASAYAHAINEFREFMIGLTGNVTISLLVRLVDEVLEKHQVRTGELRGEAWTELQQKNQRSLQRLIDMIEQHDFEKAEDFWRKHLSEASKYLFADGKGALVIDLLGYARPAVLPVKPAADPAVPLAAKAARGERRINKRNGAVQDVG